MNKAKKTIINTKLEWIQKDTYHRTCLNKFRSEIIPFSLENNRNIENY